MSPLFQRLNVLLSAIDAKRRPLCVCRDFFSNRYFCVGLVKPTLKRCGMLSHVCFYSRFAQWKAFLVRKSKRWRGLRDDREQMELVEFQPGHTYRYLPHIFWTVFELLKYSKNMTLTYICRYLGFHYSMPTRICPWPFWEKNQNFFTESSWDLKIGMQST